jgi:PAS domain S-box-containing protein
MNTKTYAPLARFIDQLLDAICVVDGEGRFIFVSAACERIFGYTPKEMIGKVMLEMVVPEDRARTLQAANEIIAGHPTLDFENRYIRKDGQVVHIMWSARWSEADQLRSRCTRHHRAQAGGINAGSALRYFRSRAYCRGSALFVSANSSNNR